jgi:hypothetical protein
VFLDRFHLWTFVTDVIHDSSKIDRNA